MTEKLFTEPVICIIEVNQMATQSFYEIMEIDTKDKVRNLEEAFRMAKERGPVDYGNSVFEELDKNARLLEQRPLI